MADSCSCVVNQQGTFNVEFLMQGDHPAVGLYRVTRKEAEHPTEVTISYNASPLELAFDILQQLRTSTQCAQYSYQLVFSDSATKMLAEQDRAILSGLAEFHNYLVQSRSHRIAHRTHE
jgi:hypothetical protein